MNGRQVLTPAQAAALLGMGKTTVVEWCQRGILPAVRIDSRWYLKRAELERDGWVTPSCQHEGAVAAADADEGR